MIYEPITGGGLLQPAEMHMRERAPECGLLLVDISTVPLGICVVADEPAYGGPRDDVGSEVPARGKPPSVHAHGVRIHQDRDDAGMRIFVRYDGSHGPGFDRMAGWEARAGIPDAAFALPETAFPRAFEGPLALSGGLENFSYDGRISQGFEGCQTGFAQPVIVSLRSQSVETGRRGRQDVNLAEPRRPGTDGDLAIGVWQLFRGPFIRCNQPRGDAAEYHPPFHILPAGAERARPDGFLIIP